MIILDLWSENRPLWQQFDSYYGKPFIWCMLHVFGGRRGLYGNLTRIATGPVAALSAPNSTMVGIGLTPEAIETNPIIYDLMTEMAWHDKPVDVPSWVSRYVGRRYGADSPAAQAAWEALQTGAYIEGYLDTALFEQRPRQSLQSSRATSATLITAALRSLTTAATDGSVPVPLPGPFLYDLVDVARQVLSNYFADLQLMHAAVYGRYSKQGKDGMWYDCLRESTLHGTCVCVSRIEF